jgi:hypothetical protein
MKMKPADTIRRSIVEKKAGIIRRMREIFEEDDSSHEEDDSSREEDDSFPLRWASLSGLEPARCL